MDIENPKEMKSEEIKLSHEVQDSLPSQKSARSQKEKKAKDRKKIIKVLTIGTGGDNQSHVRRPRRSRTNSLTTPQLMQALAQSGYNIEQRSMSNMVSNQMEFPEHPVRRPNPPQVELIGQSEDHVPSMITMGSVASLEEPSK